MGLSIVYYSSLKDGDRATYESNKILYLPSLTVEYVTFHLEFYDTVMLHEYFQ